MTNDTIGRFELIDHGIEHSQYFQGCGVAFTGFANVVTGIGDTPADAIDDCLEQMAQAGFETEGGVTADRGLYFSRSPMEARIMEEEGWEALPTTPDVQAIYGSIEEVYYHVSIRWNEGS